MDIIICWYLYIDIDDCSWLLSWWMSCWGVLVECLKWIYISCFKKSSKNLLPNGGEKWWFTVQSVKNITQKQKSKVIGTFFRKVTLKKPHALVGWLVGHVCFAKARLACWVRPLGLGSTTGVRKPSASIVASGVQETNSFHYSWWLEAIRRSPPPNVYETL